MSISGTEWLIILAVITLLFGRRQVLDLMGNAGRGLTNFRRDITEVDGSADDRGTPPPVAGA